eukprot:scaffold230506_cov44-Prasinocladus_malaysianus.AAC.1
MKMRSSSTAGLFPKCSTRRMTNGREVEETGCSEELNLCRYEDVPPEDSEEVHRRGNEEDRHERAGLFYDEADRRDSDDAGKGAKCVAEAEEAAGVARGDVRHVGHEARLPQRAYLQ